MKQNGIGFYVFSFVVAVVVLYFVMMRQEPATQQQAIINALSGGVGMVAGLFLYNRYVKKNDDNRSPD